MSAKKVKIGSFLKERKTRYKPDEANKLGLRRVNKIDFSGSIHLVEHKPTRTNMILVKKSDLLISGINAEKGGVSVYEYEEDAIASIHYSSYLYDSKKIDIEYLKWFLKSNNFKNILIEQTGSGIKSELKPYRFLSLEIVLPTMSEQKGILKRLESVNSEIEELNEIVCQNEILISKLRQSILQDAVQGKLTSDWRKRNANVESASELQKAIKSERKLKKEILITLPKKWILCNLSEIIMDTHAGKSPQCENRPAEIDEWGVLKTTAIQDLYFIPEENKALLNISKINLSTEVQNGDLLITRAGPSNRVGIVTYVNKTRHKLLLSDKTVRIRYFPNFILGQFLAVTLSTGVSKQYLDSKKTGMAKSQVNISQANMKLTPICLPPIEEQFEIVSRVNELNEHCNNLGIQIEINKRMTELLIQSVLSELLGKEKSISIRNEAMENKKLVLSRNIKYNSKTTYMELVKLLHVHGKLHAEDLWRMSEFYGTKDDERKIDSFYAELKKQIEEEKTIKEIEKGYLDLA